MAKNRGKNLIAFITGALVGGASIFLMSKKNRETLRKKYKKLEKDALNEVKKQKNNSDI